MPRRGPPGVQVLVAIGVLLLFVYGYYSYNELKSTIRKNEEAAKRMVLNEENLMTQLQGIVLILIMQVCNISFRLATLCSSV